VYAEQYAPHSEYSPQGRGLGEDFLDTLEGSAALREARILAETRIIAIEVEKGGVLKTTTTATLGHALTLPGLPGGSPLLDQDAKGERYRVLLVDTDPQHNLTTFVGNEQAEVMLSDVLLDPSRIREAIQPSRAGTAFILNGAADTATAIEQLKAKHKSPYSVLSQILDLVKDEYDFILIDTARTMDLMSASALGACTEIISPIDCDPMAVKGLGQIREQVEDLGNNRLLRVKNPPLHVLLTKYPGGKEAPAVVRDTVAHVREHAGVAVFESTIRLSQQARGAFPLGQTMIDLYPNSITALDYVALAREVVQNVR
jgi:chromosome partitioning protein